MKQSKYDLHKMAFIIPFILCVIICIGNGIYPIGKNCALHMDMYHQYCPFFLELMRKLKSADSLMYSWNIGLGSDFISVIAYYLSSPLNLLLILCPAKYVIEFMTLLIIIKLSLSGLFTFIYLKDHYKNPTYFTLVFSTAYALSGFMAAYSWNIMWLDGVMLFPLIILGVERLMDGKKPSLYYISLSLAIFANYYIAMMICMYLVLYFIYLFIITEKNRWIGLVRFGFYSLLAGGTGAVLILPELKILSYSGSSGIAFPDEVKWYFNIIAELSRMVPVGNSYNGAGNWPNLYAGSFTILLVVLYVLNQKITLKSKIPTIFIISLFVVSFANNYLDFIWHGLHFPDSLPGRQSFLFIFVLLCVANMSIKNWDGVRLWHIIVAFVLSTAGIITSGFFMDEEVTEWFSLFIGVLFILAYTIICILIKIVSQEENRKILLKFFAIIAVLEISINMAYSGFYTTDRVSYTKKVDDYKSLIELAKEKTEYNFYRIEDTERLTKNDDAKYGYPSATQFSSLMNINVSHFYQGVFMEGGKNFYGYNGATPIPSAMLSVEYALSDSEFDSSPLRELVGNSGSYYLYRNKYCLPLGFMMDKTVVEAWKPTRSSRRNGINSLGNVLGANTDMISPTGCEVAVTPGKTTIKVGKTGFYYAEYIKCNSDTLTIEKNNGKKTNWGKTTHKYLFELGYLEEGEDIEVKNSNKEEIDFIVYRLDLEAVDIAFDKLKSNTMKLEKFDTTYIKGSIDVLKPGYLIFSIPSEAGWTLYVDGKETDITDFCDTFISVDLQSGTHEIELKYETPLLKEGGAVSCACILLFVIAITIRKRKTKDEGFITG